VTDVVQVTAKFLTTLSLIALVYSLQLGFVQASTVPSFPFGEITANFQNISPADNASYIREVPVNISVRFYAFSDAKNALVPFQDIICLYRVDNGEWQNATLHNASGQRYAGSPISKTWENYVDCYYNATLQGLSNGAHLLDIDFKPDLSDHLRSSTNGKLFASEHSRPNTTLPKNASITFYNFTSNEPTTATPQPRA
jgi:hypothetical protein